MLLPVWPPGPMFLPRGESLSRGCLCLETPTPESEKRAVSILVECFHVTKLNFLNQANITEITAFLPATITGNY